MKSQSTVLILGAGINGAALARELVLNRQSVVVVDTRDLAAGTTAYSSRLIHGGLRYLEYGDFDLVRESLAERTRWLRLAPHLVRPLRLFIPVNNRWGGFGAAVRNFLRLRPRRTATHKKARGLMTIRAGLWLYDRYARDQSLARYGVQRVGGTSMPAVDRGKYRWACSYHDAQVRFPERFTLELLLDAASIADETGVDFRLFTYHRGLRHGNQIEIVSLDRRSMAHHFTPAAIVNATGAWVDYTLEELGVPSQRLIGGTKGSHFVTYHRALVEALGGDGIYAEASDGRPVFILPFGNGVLVGTTDEPFSGDPESARATPAELQYLIDAVKEVFPQISLDEADIELVYSGVRPLAASGPATPAAITRRHWLEQHAGSPLPCYSIVGGKLTTCRSLAESAARTILARLNGIASANSRERPLPGGRLAGDLCGQHVETHDDGALASRLAITVENIAAVRSLYGSRTQEVLEAALGGACDSHGEQADLLDGTPYPVALARYVIKHEWARRLDDIVERRLMLLYHRTLTRRCLEQLAELLVEAGNIEESDKMAAIHATIGRLKERFRKRVAEIA